MPAQSLHFRPSWCPNMHLVTTRSAAAKFAARCNSNHVFTQSPIPVAGNHRKAWVLKLASNTFAKNCVLLSHLNELQINSMSRAFTLIFIWSIAAFVPCHLSAQIPCSDFVFNRWQHPLMYATTIRDCITTQDGNMVIAGYYMTNYDSIRSLICKANTQGDILWRNDVIFDDTYETADAVAELPDGSFIVAGAESTLVGADTFAHAYLARFSANGKIIWDKVYETPAFQESFQDVAICPNGDMIVLGNQSTNTGPLLWVLRLDSNGVIIWSKEFDKRNGYSILAIQTGGFWLSARKYNQTSSTLYRFDDFGNIVDELTLNGWYVEKLIPINGQGFVGVGGKDNDLWIAKLDMNGGMQWEKQYGGSGNEVGHHVSAIPGGGFYVLGSTDSGDGDLCLSRGNGDHWVLQLDDAGDLLWQKTYGGSGWDAASGGIVTCPDGFIVVGETTSNDWDAADIPDHQINLSPLWIFRCNNLRYENLDIVQTDTSVCLDDPIRLNVGPLNCIGQLRWNTGETGSEIQPDSQGIYWVENLYGSCVDRDSVHIRFLPCNGESCILFPNAFTPNDDGYNDFFEPIIQCGDVAEIKIWVYNRWGQLVYKHEGLGTAGWDGKTSNGESLPSDLYIWRCSYQNLIDGQLISEIKSGEITLIR